MTPFQYGFIDGSYQGTTAVLRMAAAFFADRRGRYKEVAAAGYGVSAITKLILLAVKTWPLIALSIIVDPIGKGVRTAARDALIRFNSSREDLATSFGVHRALDACGAMLGPLVAFALLAASGNQYDPIFVASFCFALIGLAVLTFFVENPGGE